MSKRNNCGIQDKFGVPAQEQAQLKATVDGRRADIVVVGFEVAVSTLDSTVAKARSSRSALAGENTPHLVRSWGRHRCPLCRRRGRQSRATEDSPGRRGYSGWSAFLLADRNRGCF
jgi:hypothetical protein